MSIQTKRVYDPPARIDGARFLVDRLWPRGMKSWPGATGASASHLKELLTPDEYEFARANSRC